MDIQHGHRRPMRCLVSLAVFAAGVVAVRRWLFTRNRKRYGPGAERVKDRSFPTPLP